MSDPSTTSTDDDAAWLRSYADHMHFGNVPEIAAVRHRLHAIADRLAPGAEVAGGADERQMLDEGEAPLARHDVLARSAAPVPHRAERADDEVSTVAFHARRQRDEARDLAAALEVEVARLTEGVKALAAHGLTGWDLTPTTTAQVDQQWVYDYLAQIDAAWRQRLDALLAPADGSGCDTCAETPGYVHQEFDGSPGSNRWFTCPDCGPTPGVGMDDDFYPDEADGSGS